LDSYHTVSIIGTAKNAGKTTVLNKIIDEYKLENIAITSVGLDGEKIDNVTFKEKPRIKVYPKMYVATALNCLKESSIEYVIYEKTKIRTPLGEIVIIEVTKEGLVLVAGPSTKQQMVKVINKLKKYSPSKIFVDGALFRKSIASNVVADGIIVSTGASYHSNIDKVINDTKILIDQLTINTYKYECKINENNFHNNFFYEKQENRVVEIKENLLHNENIIKKHLKMNYSHFFIKGALTNRIVETIFEERHIVKNLTILLKDATHILVNNENYEKLHKMGVKINVLNQIDIILVTYNPYSPYGYTFDNNEFKEKISNIIRKEAVNVLTDLE
jgi:hypothetical protein